MTHYRISDISVNKVGAVVCITEEMLGDLNDRGLDNLLALADRTKAMQRRKAHLMNRRCPVCREKRAICRCE